MTFSGLFIGCSALRKTSETIIGRSAVVRVTGEEASPAESEGSTGVEARGVVDVIAESRRLLEAVVCRIVAGRF